MLFGENSETAIDNILNNGAPHLFFAFFKTSLIIFTILLLVGIIKVVRETGANKFSYTTLLWNSIKYTLFILLVALGLFLFILSVKTLLALTLQKDSIYNLADGIFLSIKPKEISQTDWENIMEHNYDIPSSIRNQMDNAISFAITGFVVSILSVVFLAMTIFGAVGKVLEIYFLFVVSPWVAVFTVIDKGQKMRMWIQMVVGKILALLFYIVAINIFTNFISQAMIYVRKDFDNEIVVVITQIILIVGGMMGLGGISNVVMSFVGEKLGMRESINEISQIGKFAVGTKSMMLGAGAIAGKALLGKGGMTLAKEKLGNSVLGKGIDAIKNTGISGMLKASAKGTATAGRNVIRYGSQAGNIVGNAKSLIGDLSKMNKKMKQNKYGIIDRLGAMKNNFKDNKGFITKSVVNRDAFNAYNKAQAQAKKLDKVKAIQEIQNQYKQTYELNTEEDFEKLNTDLKLDKEASKVASDMGNEKDAKFIRKRSKLRRKEVFNK
nr:hypothetical protein [Mycoplasma buteonis]